MPTDPKCFYALHNDKDVVFLTPYKLNAEQKANAEGLFLVTVSQNHPAYEACLSDWRRHLAEAGIDRPASSEDSTGPPLEDQAQRQWDQSPNLQKEFGSFSIYWAYLKASASGRGKITTRKSTTFTMNGKP